jgi:glycine rich protein
MSGRKRNSAGVRVVVAVVTSVGAVAAFSAPSGAQQDAAPVVKQYTTVGETRFTVPQNVCEVNIVAIGAAGGDAGSELPGGLGGSAEAIVQVNPRDSLLIRVGGKGGTGYPNDEAKGGSNGGGNARLFAGGGGGASDVRRPAPSEQMLVVGGGGGGAAPVENFKDNLFGYGGDGGGTNGSDGVSTTKWDDTAGKGGSQTSGGAGGGGTNPGKAGDGPKGGDGATAGDRQPGGGGGGGGWRGGGGGGIAGMFAGGGGGGSGFTPDGQGMSQGVDAGNGGNGRVTLTYSPSATCEPDKQPPRLEVTVDEQAADEGNVALTVDAEPGVEIDIQAPAPSGEPLAEDGFVTTDQFDAAGEPEEVEVSAQPGEQEIRVTATDELGNESVRTLRVDVKRRRPTATSTTSTTSG